MTAPRTESLSEIMKRLPSTRRSSRGAPAYSRFINRPVGGRIAAVAHYLRMTPNQISMISALFTFLGIAGIAFIKPAPVWGILIGLALMIGYAFDSADGTLARFRGINSKAGEWLDHVIDCVKISSLHLAVLISFYRFSDFNHAWYWVPLLFSVVGISTFFSLLLVEKLRPKKSGQDETGPEMNLPGQRHSLVKSLLVLPIDFGLLAVFFLFFGFPSVFLVLYTVMFACAVLYFAAAQLKYFRELTQLDRANQSQKAADPSV